METKILTLDERIAKLPENFQEFANRVASDAVVNALEAAAKIDANPNLKAAETAELSRSIHAGHLTAHEMIFFVTEFDDVEDFRTIGTREIRTCILDEFLLLGRFLGIEVK